MTADSMVMILARLIFGSIATFLAIIVWSKTRDVAWMLVVVGTIVAYGETVFSALAAFGLAKTDLLVVWGVSVVRLALANIPALLYALAFVVVIVRRSPRRSNQTSTDRGPLRIEEDHGASEKQAGRGKRRKAPKAEAQAAKVEQ